MSKNSLVSVLQNKQENPTIDMAKIMQMSAMKVYFQIAECSLFYAKI